MEKVEIRAIELELLEENKGQLPGLPRNPRFIRNEKYEKILQSIKDFPDMLSLRELLVYPLPNSGEKQKYIIVGGNMRYRAMRELGHENALCKIIPAETAVERLRAYTIKDNASYGKWDLNKLAQEWDRDVINEWGLDALDGWSDETKEQDFSGSNSEINVGGFEEEMTLTVQFTPAQHEWVKERLAEIDPTPTVALLKAAHWYNDPQNDVL